MKGKLKTIAFLQVLILLCSIIAPTINVFASTSKTIKITSTGITSCNVTIAVGMTPTAKQNNSKIIKINNVNENFFYLQGGVDYTKLKGIKKFKNKVQKLHFKFDVILRLCYNYICRRFGYG